MANQRSLALAALLVCLAVSGCRGEYDIRASVHGSVVSDCTGEPIARACVAFGDIAAESDSAGLFVIEELEPGDHMYQAGAAGFERQCGSVALRPGVNAVRLCLTPMTGARIFGCVLDRTTQNRVEGACVTLAGLEMRTGPTGAFEFSGVPPGLHEITAMANGYQFWQQTMEIPLAEVTITARLTRLGLNGHIVFGAIVSGRRDIYIMRADGDDRRALTATGTGNYRPALSPDGSGILFACEKDGVRRIWWMNVDGSGSVPVTAGPSDDYPAWSPTGDRFAYQSVRDGANRVLVSDLSGLTLSDLGLGRFPAWSPDATRILFIYSGQMIIAPVDGGDRVPVGPESGIYYPAWSPSGSLIAFSMKDGVGAYGLYLMDPASEAIRRAAIGKTHLRSVFSPDGSMIAFHTVGPDSSATQIYVTTSAADGDLLWISRGGGECQDPNWR